MRQSDGTMDGGGLVTKVKLFPFNNPATAVPEERQNRMNMAASMTARIFSFFSYYNHSFRCAQAQKDLFLHSPYLLNFRLSLSGFNPVYLCAARRERGHVILFNWVLTSDGDCFHD
jgi:hypothetical protein